MLTECPPALFGLANSAACSPSLSAQEPVCGRHCSPVLCTGAPSGDQRPCPDSTFTPAPAGDRHKAAGQVNPGCDGNKSKSVEGEGGVWETLLQVNPFQISDRALKSALRVADSTSQASKPLCHGSGPLPRHPLCRQSRALTINRNELNRVTQFLRGFSLKQ